MRWFGRVDAIWFLSMFLARARRRDRITIGKPGVTPAGGGATNGRDAFARRRTWIRAVAHIPVPTEQFSAVAIPSNDSFT